MTTEDKSEVENGAKDERKKSASKLVALGKDLVALLRDLVLFVLALLLLFFPATLNNVLTNAGFEEGSFVGFKWKPKLLNSDAALQEAQALITDLREQNEKLSRALADAQSELNDPALKEKLAKLQEVNKQLSVTSSKVENSVASIIASNAPLVEKVQNEVDTNTKWGVVFSGDATLEAAKPEVEKVARDLGIPNASIYFRQGSFRSVSVVDSRAEAQQVLPKAKRRRADAYIVNMSNWCPSSNEKNGYRECVSP
jgi:cytoskeletal protein RodZ